MRHWFGILGLLLCLAAGVHAQVRPEPPVQADLPRLAWHSIPQEFTTVARYRELHDAGFTHSFTTLFSDLGQLLWALDTAAVAGVRLIATCPELRTNTAATVARLRDHPAFAAYYIADEPNALAFDSLAAFVRTIQALDSIHPCYINLLPAYATFTQFGTYTYRSYIDRFIRQVPAPLLSFDSYPVLGDRLRDDWYENLEFVATRARESGRPFWGFVLSVPHGPYPVPSLAQLRLQAFSNLACGAQGIQYFAYWTPGSATGEYYHGPIDTTHLRTEVYDRVAAVNREIDALTPHFAGATFLLATHLGATRPPGTAPLDSLPAPIRNLRVDGTGALLTVLEKDGYRYCALVNQDFRHPMRLTLSCDAMVERILKDGRSVPANRYAETLEVDAGDLMLYRWPLTP